MEIFMSMWNDIKKSVGAIADKTVTKTREITDTASLKLKIASKEADRDTEYKKLGKLTYFKLKNDAPESSESLTREISETIEKLDCISAELLAMKNEEEARRAAKDSERTEKSEKNTNKEAEKNTEDK